MDIPGGNFPKQYNLLGKQNFGPADYFQIMLLNNDVIIGTYVSHDFGSVTIRKPMSARLGQHPNGQFVLQMIPFGVPLFQETETVSFAHQHVLYCTICIDAQLIKGYQKQVSGLHVPSTKEVAKLNSSK